MDQGSPEQFLFVNYDTKTKGQGPESPLRSVKRAYVAREYYRKIRQHQMKAWTRKSVTEPWTGKFAAGTEPGKRQQSSRRVFTVRRPKRTEPNLESEYELVEDVSDPRTKLGQGRLDPFGVFPAERVPLLVHELLDHGKQFRACQESGLGFPCQAVHECHEEAVLERGFVFLTFSGLSLGCSMLTLTVLKAMIHYWTGLAPDKSGNTLGPVHKAWMVSTRASPLLFYAFVYATSYHYDFVHDNQGTSSPTALLRLSYKTQVIKLVNEMLSDFSRGISDELIASILVLAFQGPRVKSSESSRFQSPMAAAQWINHHGSQIFEPEHAIALIQLVRLKGGLKEIRMQGIAETVAVADILGASLSLSKPNFPLMNPPESFVESGKHVLDDEAMDLAFKLGSGFHTLHVLDLDAGVWRVLAAMCEVTVALDHYHRGGSSAPTLADLVTARNSAQHQLLSLPLKSWDSSSQSDCMYEICRLTALIYSNIVIFPLPPASGVDSMLAFRLRETLDCVVFSSCSKLHLPFLLWAITLGGISSSLSSKRGYFLHRFTEVSTKLGLVQWDPIQERLSSFLWLDFVCEKEGVAFWLEARDLIYRDSQAVQPVVEDDPTGF